jgi:hypothetical protein
VPPNANDGGAVRIYGTPKRGPRLRLIEVSSSKPVADSGRPCHTRGDDNGDDAGLMATFLAVPWSFVSISFSPVI